MLNGDDAVSRALFGVRMTVFSVSPRIHTYASLNDGDTF